MAKAKRKQHAGKVIKFERLKEGFLSIFCGEECCGSMPLTTEGEKAARLATGKGQHRVLGDGEKAVVLSDGLTLLEARDLTYDTFGFECAHSFEGWHEWFWSRAEQAGLEEQREMMSGITHTLHMAAAMGLEKLVEDILDSGTPVDATWVRSSGPCTAIELAAQIGYSPIGVMRLLSERGSARTQEAAHRLLLRGLSLVPESKIWPLKRGVVTQKGMENLFGVGIQAVLIENGSPAPVRLGF